MGGDQDRGLVLFRGALHAFGDLETRTRPSSALRFGPAHCSIQRRNTTPEAPMIVVQTGHPGAPPVSRPTSETPSFQKRGELRSPHGRPLVDHRHLYRTALNDRCLRPGSTHPAATTGSRWEARHKSRSAVRSALRDVRPGQACLLGFSPLRLAMVGPSNQQPGKVCRRDSLSRLQRIRRTCRAECRPRSPGCGTFLSPVPCCTFLP